jgi:hypothetical protein
MRTRSSLTAARRDGIRSYYRCLTRLASAGFITTTGCTTITLNVALYIAD